MERGEPKSKQRNPLSTTRRVIWYALRTLLIICAVLALCYAVFTEAMYISNMYIVATEGMALRAETILTSGSMSELEQYFTEEQLMSDYLLHSGRYAHFTVDNYDYRYEIKAVKVLPWSTAGSITYIERIPSISATADVEAPEGAVAPQWTSVEYSIVLSKIEGRWLISGLSVLEENPPEEVLPTPDYGQLATP